MKMLKNNWRLKLLSLIVAVFLWSFVISEENPNVTTWINSIPVVYENEEALSRKGLILTNKEKPYVSLEISGQRSQVVNITPQHIRVSADLEQYGEGVHVLRYKYEMPNGIEIVNLPAPQNIEIEAIITKDFHVEIDLQGAIKEGYILESTQTTPETISVRGPRSAVESIAAIKAALDTSTLEKDLVSNVNIVALDKDENQVENVTLGQNFINVTAIVSQSKQVDFIADTSNELGPDLRLKGITLDPDTLIIKGDGDIISQINEIKSNKIDLSSITGTTNIDVTPNLPTGLSLVNSEQVLKARVDVDKKEERSFRVPTTNIVVENLEEGKIIEYDNEDFVIVVKAFGEELEKIDPSILTPKYTIRNNNSESINIKPEFNLAEEYEIISIESVLGDIK